MGPTRRSASVVIGARKGTTTVAAMRTGQSLVLSNSGGATTASFELTQLSATGLQRFASGTVAVPAGATVTASPRDWRSLSTVTVTVKDARGSVTTRVLSNRARSATRLALSRPALSRTARGTKLSLRYTVARPVTGSRGGVVVRVQQGRRIVARTVLALTNPGRGRTLSWTLPRLARGSYTVVADATLVVVGTGATTLRARSSSVVRLR